MAADASIRLAVEGGSSFKQAMQAAESSVKLFNTQLKNLANYMTKAGGNDAQVAKRVELLGNASQAAQQKVRLLTQEQQKQLSKLDELTAALDKANKENGETSVEAEKAANAVNKQTKVVNDLGIKLEKAQTEADKFDSELQSLQKDSSGIGSQFKSIVTGTQEVGDSFDKAGQKALSFKDVLGANIFGGLIQQGISLAVNELRQFVQEIINVGSEYEAQMAKVSAISGAYKDTTGKTLRELEALTKDLSGYFTQTEIGQAMEFEAMAGWNVDEIKEATEAILNLAQAGGVDLERAAELMTTGLSGFGLGVENAYRYADILAKTAASANTSVDDMGDAFAKVAPIAQIAGFSVEDLAVAVGIMGNNAITGRKAGTSLKAIVTELVNPSEKAAKAFDELGIALKDDEGNFLTFEQIIQNIRTATTGMDASELTKFASEIVGTGDAMQAFAAIINTSDEDFNQLQDAISGSTGAAAEMAEVMGDTYEGATKRAHAATENLQKSLFNLFEGPLMGVQEGIASFANSLADAIENGSPLIGIIAGIAAGLAAMGIANAITAMGGLVGMVQSLTTAFQGLNMAMGVIGLIAAAVTALIVLYNTNEDFAKFVDTAWSMILDVIGGVVNALVTFFTETIPNAIQRTIDFFTEDIPNAVNAVVEFFAELPGKIGQFLLDCILKAYEWYTEMTTKARETAVDFVLNVGEGLVDLAVTIWNALKAGLQAVANFVIELNNSANEASRQFSDTLISGFKALPGKMVEIGKNIIQGLWNGIKAAFGVVRDRIVGIVNDIKSLFTGAQGFNTHSPSRWSEEIGENVMRGLAIGMNSETNSILPTVKNAAQKVGDAIQTELDRVTDEINRMTAEAEKEKADAELEAHEKAMQEKYAELEKAEISNKQKILDEIAKLQSDWDKKQLDAERTATQNSLKERQKYWESLKKDFEKQIEEIERKEESMTKKISDYGELFTKTKTETGEIFALNDLDKDIAAIEQYGEALAKLQVRGVDESLLSEITSMNLDDATAYMGELLSMTDEQYDTYMAKWAEKQQLARDIAQEFYKSEMEEVSREMLNTMQDFKTQFDATGKYLMVGVAQGIEAGESLLIESIRQTLQAGIDEANAMLDIHSPSRVFAKIGKNMAAGLGVGWLNEMQNINEDIKLGLISTQDTLTNAGIMNATAAAVNGINASNIMTANNGQPVYVQVVLDGRQIAQAVFDPLKQVSKQRGAKIG